MYGEENKLTENIISYGANSLHIYYSGDERLCGYDMLVVNEILFGQKWIVKCPKHVLKGNIFEFVPVDIEVTDKFYDNFIEMVLLFALQEMHNCNISEEIKMYKEKIGKEAVKETKKLLGIMKVFCIHLWPSDICNMVWGLQQLMNWLNMNSVSFFSWFSEKLVNGRQEANKDSVKKAWVTSQNRSRIAFMEKI